MKKLLYTMAATLLTIAAFGQGVVNFSNASSIPGWNPVQDRNVYFGIGTGPLMGMPVSTNAGGMNFTTVRAALYYSPPPIDNTYFWYQASGGPATFRGSTSTTAGSWFGGNRTLDNIAPGSQAFLRVVVWDSALTPNPIAPQAFGGFWSVSDLISYTPPTSPTADASEFLMQNLSDFEFGAWVFPNPFPEPSTLALLVSGGTMLLLLRRSNKRLN